MENPLISIIIPSYNQVNFIENTILSIVHQEYENWELIIQDAGSTDSTAEVCSKYAKQDKRICFFQEADAGFADAVNKALNKCSGTLGCIQSSDDFYADKSVLSAAISIYKKYPELLIISGRAVSVDTALKIILAPVVQDPTGFMRPDLVLHFNQGSTFFSIARANAIGGLDKTIDMVADTDFWCRMAAYHPVKENTIFLTNQIWSCVTTHSHQRSSDQKKFYLGRAKMAVKHYHNSNIDVKKSFKYNRAAGLLADAFNYYNTIGADTSEINNLYKTFTGKNISIKRHIKNILSKFTVSRKLIYREKYSTSSMDILSKYPIAYSMKWF